MSLPFVGPHPEATGQVGLARPENRPDIAPFCAISPPHAQVLVHPRQVIAKAESLVKGDNPRFVVANLLKQHVGSIHNVYEKLVLRAWRYGEPHQGTAAVSVYQPRQLFADARKSVAAIIFLVRKYADADLAAVGTERYAVQLRTILNAQCETFENRFTG